MAEHLAEILGEENFYVLPESTSKQDFGLYPSPDALKRKFIIKAKRKRIVPHDLGSSEESLD